MRKGIALFLTVVLCLTMGACGAGAPSADDGKITVVATIFPEYDWLRKLTAGSDAIDLKLLIDNGVDLHSYQPNVADIVTISTCDVFVYTGGASDVWVEDAIATAMNEDMMVINLMDLLEEHRALCTDEHTHDHGEEHHAHAADEHIWLSLVNAEAVCHSLTHILQELDSENTRLYHDNFEGYAAEMMKLDEQYRETVETAKHHDVLFADRFPFTYLMEDYGLHHHAAYEGCSAETEVGFETFARLAEELKALDLGAVVVIDDSDHRIADTVIASSGKDHVDICTLQTMQAVSRRQISGGITYLDIMEENLNVLAQVLN